MAAKHDSNGKPTGKHRGGGNVRWVDVRLTADDKDRIREAIDDGTFTLESVLDFLAEGYKFGARYDERNHTFVATLTDQRTQPTRVLSGRGSTAINAIASLAYRHVVLLAGDWESVGETASNNDFD